ncbi:SDR family oxidoreductase [Pyruvatibacter mobilis]|uniref:SDR family oxidoreductase n=1 Tax=Pyruvatibacter mobilis TaxID=1712261 RepID=UPI003BAC0BED
MSGRVSGKMAMVTGGASGLGAATSKLLVEEGARVVIADINLAGAEQVAAEINQAHPDTALAVELDVTSEQQWQDALETAVGFLGGLNVLVNNAGIGGSAPVEDETFENWKKIQAVDLDSVFLGCKYALGHMKAHQPGSIVNISSIAGLIAGHNMGAYNAAKAGVWLFSKSVALHCAKRGYDIRSNSVHPTFIRTPILEGLFAKTTNGEEKLAKQVPLGRIGEPNDVAYAVLYLASDESRFVTGAEIKIDGGISAM